MNFLFDLNHPAHFHLFKNVILSLKQNGNNVLITARPKDVLISLLESSGIPFIPLKKSNNRVFDNIQNVTSLIIIFKENKIDLAIGVSAIIAQASIFSSIKSIVFDDDDITATRLFAMMSHTFANHVISPILLQKERNRKKDIFHHSLHELAYLHPSHFVPNDKILDDYHLDKNQFYSIIRLSALKAQHDVGEKGISRKQSLEIIEILSLKGKVLISSEKELSADLRKFSIIKPQDFHDLLSFSSILVCDSQTVASEAAVLGVPSVRINTFVGRISYLEELEHKYHLTFGFRPSNFDLAIKKIEQIINQEDRRVFSQQKREKLLTDKIDLTAFMVWFIENYPESAKIMKEKPDYQYNFK